MKDHLRHHNKVDLDLLEKFAEVLRPFKEVTTLMSSQTTVTASLIKPLLMLLIATSKPQDGELVILHQAKAALYHDLQTRLKANDTIMLDKCSFCDPRVKSLSHLDTDRRSLVHSSVIASLEIAAAPQADAEIVEQPEQVQAPQTKGSLLSSLLPDFEHSSITAGVTSTAEICRDEVERYQRAVPYPMDQEPLAW